MATLSELLQKYSAPGTLFEKLNGKRVRCFACGHRCEIPDGAMGICKMRFNQGGILRVPFGYVSGAQHDPIEKKPFFHVRPGAMAYSFGMLGCNFHCAYCQNWSTSQVLRDPDSIAPPLRTAPSAIISAAVAQEAEIVVSTYNEPLITSEWAMAVFTEAKAANLLTGFVSNGHGTAEVLRYLQPCLDLYKVDLKSFDESQYRKLGGTLQAVLETIQNIYSMGIWLEIVTLLIPGFNDSRKELEKLTAFIAGVSADIPWHVTAFHRNYRMTDPENTTSADLLKAVEIGRKSGLQYIYAGNLPGQADKWENTYCPKCGALLVERCGYQILGCHLSGEGNCPSCAQKIPGRWAPSLPSTGR